MRPRVSDFSFLHFAIITIYNRSTTDLFLRSYFDLLCPSGFVPPVVVAAHQVEDHDVEAPEEEEKDQHGTDGDQTGIQRPLEFRHDDLQGVSVISAQQ